MNSRTLIFFVVLAMISSWDTCAFGYIDPGTGGIVYSYLATILGFIAVFFVTVLRYFKGIRNFFKKLLNRWRPK